MDEHVTVAEEQERHFWNSWTMSHGDRSAHHMSRDEKRTVQRWLGDRRGLRLLDVGCGYGWMTEALTDYGTVVGTDLADASIAAARRRAPDATFVAGDIMTVDVGRDFDVVVSFEVLSHVADRPAFIRRIRSILVPGGQLMLATQNRPVLQRYNTIAPPAPGQRRAWVDRAGLRDLLTSNGFVVEELFVKTPMADHGPLRYVAKAGRLLRFSGLLERAGFGWTIMVRATRT